MTVIVLGVVTFVLEVTAWVALARWGAQVGMTVLSRWCLALLAPLAFMAFWGAFLSPKAAYGLPVAVRDGLIRTPVK